MKIILLVLLVAQSVFADDLLDRVVTSVSGEAITESEIRDFAAEQGVTLPRTLTKSDPALGSVLQGIVFLRLLDQEAARFQVSVSDAEVESYIGAVKAQNGFSNQSDFAEELRTQGYSVDAYRRQVRMELLRARVLSAVTRTKVHISEEEVEGHLPEVDESSLSLEEYTVSSDEKMSPEMVVSEGKKRDLGVVDVSELKPEIAQALQSVEEGELAGPVGMKYFRLVKGGNSSERKKMREKLKERLFEARRKEVVDEYLTRELPKRYDIQTYL